MGQEDNEEFLTVIRALNTELFSCLRRHMSVKMTKETKLKNPKYRILISPYPTVYFGYEKDFVLSYHNWKAIAYIKALIYVRRHPWSKAIIQACRYEFPKARLLG